MCRTISAISLFIIGLSLSACATGGGKVSLASCHGMVDPASKFVADDDLANREVSRMARIRIDQILDDLPI
jgi:hypothetical protein